MARREREKGRKEGKRERERKRKKDFSIEVLPVECSFIHLL